LANVVYVLTNEAMPGFVKIGVTDQPIEARIKQLDTTGVPLPFEVFMAVATEKPMRDVEQALHAAFGDVRVRPNREFFQITPERLAKLLRLFGSDVTQQTVIPESAEDKGAIEAARERRPNFNFNMVGIPVGSLLTFDYDGAVTCTVASPRTVTFRGSETSLSRAALQALAEKDIHWTAVQGSAVWRFNGELLADLRARLEAAE
jgi:T5orf172 domain